MDLFAIPQTPLPPVTRRAYAVRDVDLGSALWLVEAYHYAGGAANTATYLHGLFAQGQPWVCLGAAWWIPPTKHAAIASFPENWQGVLSLSRLVIHPAVPKNGASFLLGRSMAMIDRERWPCLVTYADEWRGHTGGIYRATNWEYVGRTERNSVWVKDGRMVARKAGPKTRTHAEMRALGAECMGYFAKHKFRHVVK
jgi:hypothetical protein